jgi:hypothetical protein
MKPTNVIDMQRSGDLGGDKVAMKFDENSIAHIMSVLTDLYSDPELAIIREYSTNAIDSHIAAGVKRAIEVTLPNNMSPYFKVKDFGLGMDTSDIENVYSKYGASTKRNDNTSTGMLGLGCKSALTYTSQFTVTGVKNGVKTVAVVSRIEDGTGVMEIVDVTSSTDGNGVEISIPVKVHNTIARKAMNFFKFWETGTVLVNGEPVEKITGQQVTPNMMTISSHEAESDIVVMGGVPYPIDSLYNGFRPHYDGFRVVAFVEIGEVNFTPSREALSETTTTKNTVARLKGEFTAALDKTVRSEVNTAADHPAALAKFMEWSNILQRSMPANVTYNGEAIPLRWPGTFNVWHRNRNRYSMSHSTQIDHDTLNKAAIVTDYNGIKITPRHKQKMVAWMEEKGFNVSQFVICTDQPGLPWVKNERVVSWADILAIKLESGPRSKSIPKYDIYSSVSGYTQEIEVDDLDVTKPLYYVSPKEKVGAQCIKQLTAALGAGTIVAIGENRWGKFLTANPTAKHIGAAILAKVKETADALTENDKINLAMDYNDKAILSHLDDTLINDPVIKDAIKTAKGLTTSPTIEAYQKAKTAATGYGQYVEGISAKSVLGGYPLVKGSYNTNAKHVTIYINAVYAATQNGAI